MPYKKHNRRKLPSLQTTFIKLWCIQHFQKKKVEGGARESRGTRKRIVEKHTVSTLNPMVGMVVTTSPSFNLYRMVVLPAASRPTMRIRMSFLLTRRLHTCEKRFPIVYIGCEQGLVVEISQRHLPAWRKPREKKKRYDKILFNKWKKGPSSLNLI